MFVVGAGPLLWRPGARQRAALTFLAGMLATQRTSLINRGLATAEQFFPVALTFAGFAAFAGSRRASAAGVAFLAGGLTDSAPVMIYARKEFLPEGLLETIRPETTTFDAGADTLRVLKLDNEPNEPHVRFICNLAPR